MSPKEFAVTICWEIAQELLTLKSSALACLFPILEFSHFRVN
jgi:hypothetical protein